MSANFTGITFDDCNVSPSDDGLINRTILPDGILSGCEICDCKDKTAQLEDSMKEDLLRIIDTLDPEKLRLLYIVALELTR